MEAEIEIKEGISEPIKKPLPNVSIRILNKPESEKVCIFLWKKNLLEEIPIKINDNFNIESYSSIRFKSEKEVTIKIKFSENNID